MKKRLFAFLFSMLITTAIWSVFALANGADAKAIDRANETVIYVSNETCGSGTGDTPENATTFIEAFQQINETKSDDGKPVEFVISLTENIQITRGSDIYLNYNSVTILGNGHSITTNRSIMSSRQVENDQGKYENIGTAELSLGLPDGTDKLTLIGTESNNCSIIGAVYDGVVHMYDGVTITQGDTLSETDENVGSAAFSNHGGKFYMHGGVIENIYSSMSSPGAIQVYNATFEMSGGTIRNCATDRRGAAVFADNSSVLYINGTIENNRSGESGGAIYIQNKSQLVMGSEAVITDNYSGGNGGAVCALGGSSIKISGATFSGNTSASYGGALYVQRESSGNNGTYEIENAVFQDNSATYGGAVLILGGIGEMSIQLNGCSLTGNKAVISDEDETDGGFGGAIYAQDSKLALNDCVIEDNKAEMHGGGVYFTGTDMSYSAFNVGGATIIWDNSAVLADNVYLLNLTPEEEAAVSGFSEEYQTKLNITGALSDNNDLAKIGIYMDLPGIFTENYSVFCGETDPNVYFISDDASNYHVRATDDKTEAMLAAGATTYTITTTVIGNGSISPSGEIPVQAGGNQIFVFSPKPNYQVKDVLVDGKSIGNPANYEFKDVDSSHTISVEFEPTQFKITYDLAGGILESGNPDSYNVETAEFTLNNPTRDGYTFLGWTKDGESTPLKTVTIPTGSSGNMNFTAHWQKNDSSVNLEFTLSYNTNGGSDIPSETKNHIWTKSYEELPVPIRQGYVFEGWYLDSNLTKPVENDISINRFNFMIYAKWSEDKTDPDNNGVSDLLDTENHSAYLLGYGDGSFGPDNDMTRAEAAQMFYNLLLNKSVPVTVSFSDVPSDAWYSEAVNKLASIGILKGTGDNRFEPDRPITRAEFTVICMRFTDGEIEGENIFTDVHEDDWFYDQIVGSIQYEWIVGYDDGTFRPYNTITRAEAVIITNRMLDRSADKDYVDSHTKQIKVFDDVPDYHESYYQIVEATNSHTYTKTGGAESWNTVN